MTIVETIEKSFTRFQTTVKDLVLNELEMKTQLRELKNQLLEMKDPIDLRPPTASSSSTPLINVIVNKASNTTVSGDCTSKEPPIRVEPLGCLNNGKLGAGGSDAIGSNRRESSGEVPKCGQCEEVFNDWWDYLEHVGNCGENVQASVCPYPSEPATQTTTNEIEIESNNTAVAGAVQETPTDIKDQDRNEQTQQKRKKKARKNKGKKMKLMSGEPTACYDTLVALKVTSAPNLLSCDQVVLPVDCFLCYGKFRDKVELDKHLSTCIREGFPTYTSFSQQSNETSFCLTNAASTSEEEPPTNIGNNGQELSEAGPKCDLCNQTFDDLYVYSEHVGDCRGEIETGDSFISKRKQRVFYKPDATAFTRNYSSAPTYIGDQSQNAHRAKKWEKKARKNKSKSKLQRLEQVSNRI